MIRFRQKATGAEAEWDRGEWSGDPDLVQMLELAMRIEHLPAFAWHPFQVTQKLMAEQLPEYGLVAVEQTAPVEDPWDPDVVR